jgi:hypothetical protein
MKKPLVFLLIAALQVISFGGCTTPVPKSDPVVVFTPTLINFGGPAVSMVDPTQTLAPTSTLAPTRTPLPTFTPVPTPTRTPSPGDPLSRYGTPSWVDTMENDDHWPRGVDEFTNLNVVNGAMRLTGMSQSGGWRLATTPRLTSFYVEMIASPEKCTGKDYYGIFYRAPIIQEADQGYMFGVSCDGYYVLKKWDGKVQPDGETTTLINWTPHAAIIPGSSMTNRIGVLAQDSEMAFFANGQHLQSFYDASYPAGYIGVLIKPEKTTKFTVVIDNFAYWTKLY